jgi:hypothetical protein
MVVAIHQPNFLPWLGYFHKLAHVDAFVFLDTVQYTRNSFINRNRIKTKTGAQWLTLPVRTSGKFGQVIAEVLTVSDQDWRRKHLNALATHYRRTPYFEEVFALLETQYTAVEAQTTLADFNINLTRTVCSYLKLKSKLVRARDLVTSGNSTELLVSICRGLGADAYLAGRGALKYQEDEYFKSAGIQVQYSEFAPQFYSQMWGSFIGNLSVVDALMNCGQQTQRLLRHCDSLTPEFPIPESPSAEGVR